MGLWYSKRMLGHTQSDCQFSGTIRPVIEGPIPYPPPHRIGIIPIHLQQNTFAKNAKRSRNQALCVQLVKYSFDNLKGYHIL